MSSDKVCDLIKELRKCGYDTFADFSDRRTVAMVMGFDAKENMNNKNTCGPEEGLKLGDRTLASLKDYETLLDSLTTYLVILNRDLKILVSNNLFRQRFNPDPDHFCYQAWKGRTEVCSDCPAIKTFADGHFRTAETCAIDKSGNLSEFLVEFIPIKNKKGEVAHIVEVATDITERKHLIREIIGATGQIEKLTADRILELQDSEARYRTIFERSADAIVLTDSSFKIVDINPAAVKLFGFDSSQPRQVCEDLKCLFVYETEFYSIVESMQRDGYIRDAEVVMRNSGNDHFHALITGNLLSNGSGEITGYVTFIRDLSEQKKIEASLKQANAELRALNSIAKTVGGSLKLNDILNDVINNVKDTLQADSVRIYLLDDENESLYLAAHTGLSEDFISRPHIKFRKVGEGLLGQAAKKGKAIIVEDLRKAPTPFKTAVFEEDLQAAVYIPLTSKGNVLGILCVSTHYPHKFTSKHMEFLTGIGVQIGMAVENANLYAETERAYKQLQIAQDQLIRTEKLVSLGKLAATIAHEINNPLSAVITYIKLMTKIFRQEFVPVEKVRDVRKFLGIMESETVRCANIVKDLLAFSRQSSLDKKLNSIEEIVDRALAIIGHDLNLKGIKVRREISPELPRVPCDFQQMQQAILNLFSNAAEAIETDGNILVMARLVNNAKEVEIVVKDDGVGIDPQDIPFVFEPFFTTKKEGKGVGLGLAVVYGIIKKHGGRIEVDSEPGKGTTFQIYLPVEEI